MKQIKFLFLIILLVCIFQGCHKTVIINPTACMTLSANILHLSDTLIVNNCSKAEITYVAFTDSINPNPNDCKCTITSNTFNENNKLMHVFSHTGTNYVYLTAINNQTGTHVETQLMSVKVLP